MTEQRHKLKPEEMDDPKLCAFKIAYEREHGESDSQNNDCAICQGYQWFEQHMTGLNKCERYNPQGE